MQVLFSFDTEDYVDPLSNDVLLRLAEIHTRYDVPACFGLVGEKARFLRACGRRDVIEAVARHEVGYHSDHHFFLPDARYEPEFTPEYVETQPWDMGMARLLKEESRGIQDIAEIFGKRPVTWLRTSGDYAPQLLFAHARLGLPIYAYGPVFNWSKSRHVQAGDCAPIWTCNQLAIANPRMEYEQNLHNERMTPEEKLAAHKQNFLKHLESGLSRFGVLNHPTRFITDVWFEDPNWTDRTDAPPRGEWTRPPRFSREKIESLRWIADEFVKFVSRLKEVKFVTFADFWPVYGKQRQWLTRDEIVQLAVGLTERPTHQRLGAETFSPAELFGAFALALSNPEVREIPVRRIMGPTEEPVETASGCRMARDDLAAACRTVEWFIQDRDRVPHAIKIGRGEVGPGGFLLAMARALREPAAEQVEIPPAENLPAPLHDDDYEQLASGDVMGYTQKRGAFDHPNLSRMSQLQYWTVKPATPQRQGT